jgi:hypothetical protein
MFVPAKASRSGHLEPRWDQVFIFCRGRKGSDRSRCFANDRGDFLDENHAGQATGLCRSVAFSHASLTEGAASFRQEQRDALQPRISEVRCEEEEWCCRYRQK